MAIFTLFTLSLPIIAIFGGIVAYTITKLMINILDKSFLLGYKINEEYNSFLDLDVPYISMFFLKDI